VTLGLRFAARSHLGLIREGNEDSAYAGPRVLAVADGMGGHAAGEVASAVAIAALAPLDEDAPDSDLLAVLRGRAEAANDHLRDMVHSDHGLEGMGTTLTAFLFAGNRLGLLHIGDSRAYLLRDGSLSQITNDHTLVQRLVDEGRISEEEAGSHPQRSLITRALDGREGIEPDLSVREARVGDRYLLCTDGLTGPVARLETLREALALENPQEACDRLVQLALRGGGPDNVTVIVADVLDADALGHAPPLVVGAAADAPQPPLEGLLEHSAARARTAEGRDVDAPPRPSPPPPIEPPRRRGRAALLALLVLALVAAGAGAAYAYLRSQYYVGLDGSQVAIFQGVAGSLAGVDFASVARRTELTTERLDRLSLSRVEQGIVARDRTHAERIVASLEQDHPACTPLDELPSTLPSPDPSPQPTSGATGVPTPRSAAAATSPSPTSALPPLCPAGAS
jgi:serine/threonine protein phosphatase PrpC